MTYQDRVSIIITFVIGLLVGSYLYVAGFSQIFAVDDVVEETAYTGLVITADSYGACEAVGTCLSFQVLGDGTYRALFDSTGTEVAVDGVLSRALERQLAVFSAATLAADTLPLPEPFCIFGEDETNFRFVVSLNQAEYRLDTCQTTINYEGPAWVVLQAIWTEIATQ